MAIPNPDSKLLKQVHTVRTEDEINVAVKQGYKVLIKPVVPSPDIKVKYAVLQHKVTGAVRTIHDYQQIPNGSKDTEEEVLIGFTYYYPYHFPSPFAAYIIPKDIAIGERVLLIDVIEDVVGTRWNQGDTYRLEQAEAIWNGFEFIIRFKRLGLDNNDIVG